MARPQPGAWQHQDGQIIARMSPTGDSHAQEQWDRRVEELADRPDLVGLSVRVAWAEAEKVAAGDAWCRRAHPSGMVIVSQWGCIQTAFYDPRYAESSNRNSDMRFTEADS